jgi:hypothetical protein
MLLYSLMENEPSTPVESSPNGSNINGSPVNGETQVSSRKPLLIVLGAIIALPAIAVTAYVIFLAFAPALLIGVFMIGALNGGMAQKPSYEDHPYYGTSSETKEICDANFGYNDKPVIKLHRDTAGSAPFVTSAEVELIMPQIPSEKSKCFYNKNLRIDVDYGDGSPLFHIVASTTPDLAYSLSHTYTQSGIYPVTAVTSGVRPIDDDHFDSTTTIFKVGALPSAEVPANIVSEYNQNLNTGVQLEYCRSADRTYYFSLEFLRNSSHTDFDAHGGEFAQTSVGQTSHIRAICVVVARHDPHVPSNEVVPYWIANAAVVSR